MTRTRRYIIMKETAYFPDTEAYDEVQKKKAASKYNLVNILHPLFLLLVMLLMLWPLLGYPNRYEILEKCNGNGTLNPTNHTWNFTEEEKAWKPYYHWARAYNEIFQLQNVTGEFNATDSSPINYVNNSTYFVDNPVAVNESLVIIEPAMNQAYAEWQAEYRPLRDCAEKYVAEDDYNYRCAIMLGFVILYTLIFLISLCVREIFLHNMVKKEFTSAEWKKVSHNNMFFICVWLFISLLFIGYLFWMPDRRRAYLHGILARHWNV